MRLTGIILLAIAGLIPSAAPLAHAQVAPASASSVSIPDPVALFREVEAHQHKMDEIRENYTFHQIRRTDDLDKNGAVTKTASQEREVFFVNGRRIGSLVKKDGLELSAPEQKSEQARVRKLVERDMKSAPGGGRGGNVGLIGEILAVAKISNPRRISLNGRDTLAFDFAGDPSAHAHGISPSALRKTAGTIWIDEADRQVARLEVRLDDNFHLGGGLLASIQKGTTIHVEQSPVGQGLWMQTASETHVAARLVVKSLRQNIHIRNFDFKRFDVGVLQQNSPPSRLPIGAETRTLWRCSRQQAPDEKSRSGSRKAASRPEFSGYRPLLAVHRALRNGSWVSSNSGY